MSLQLTPQQAEAIARADQDLLIRASAGAGKTSVLTEMVARLVQEFQVDLANIVVITFTEKAAQELKQRLAKKLSCSMADLLEVPIGTIHGFAARLLREQVSERLPRDFIIWDESRTALERHRIVHQQLEQDLKQPSPDLALLVESYGWSTLHNLLSQQLGMRWKMARAEALTVEAGDVALWQAYVASFQHMNQVYFEHKRRRGALDFEDLEEEALPLLQAGLGASLAQQYRHIFVDECQDISPPQFELITQLHQPGTNRLVVVGDPLQSIYRFRGAEVDLFRQLKMRLKENQGSEVKLLHNFRSTETLIDQLNDIFVTVFTDDYEPMQGMNRSADSGLETILLPETKNVAERRAVEAQLVAQKIQQYCQQGYAPEDIAVLFRNRLAMPSYEAELQAQDIPFHSQHGEFLLDQPEIIDQLQVLRALVFPHDSVAMAGWLRSPLGHISDDILWELRAQPDLMKVKRLQGAHEEEQQQWEAVRSWWLALQAEAPSLKVSEIAQRLYQRAQQQHSYESPTSLRQLYYWVGFLEWLEDGDPFVLADMLAVLEGFRADGARIPAWAPIEEEVQGVQLMTVHASKGLEFPIVILADLKASLPAQRNPILIEPSLGVALKQLNTASPGLKNQLEDTPAVEALKEGLKAQDIAESRRLLYVACTRAEQHLVLPLDQHKKEKQATWNKWLCEALTN